MAEYVKPAFHSDSYALFLLKFNPAYINIFQNGFGALFFGSAHSRRDMADDALKNKRRKPVYRVVVRLKDAAR